MTDESDATTRRAEVSVAGPSTERAAAPPLLDWVPKVGVWAWSFVGFVVAATIVVAALGAVSEIVLPLTFAAVLAVIFKPAVGILERHRVKPTLAAILLGLLGLLALLTGVIVATVRGITDQTDEIGDSVDAALSQAADTPGIDQASLDTARAATEQAAPAITGGFVTHWSPASARWAASPAT
jgi:putative heme transporter